MLKLFGTAVVALIIALGITGAAFVALKNECSSFKESTPQLERANQNAESRNLADKKYGKLVIFELRVTEQHKIEGQYYAQDGEGEEQSWVHKFICEIKIGEFSVAAFTLFLVIFTGMLWGSTHRLWGVTVETLKHAEATAQREMRAYVHVTKAPITDRRHMPTIGANGLIPGNIHTFQIVVELENRGRTPTRHGLMNVNHIQQAEPLPKDFPYLDGPKTETVLIGPDHGVMSPVINVPVDRMMQVVRGNQRLFIWGWIDYNDVFPGTPRHRTEFCFEIVPDRGMPITDENTTLRSEFHGPHNGADGDCQRQPKPFHVPT